MIVVIDTNVLLSMAGSKHPHGRILDAWLNGRFHWAVSTDILNEYEEILARFIGPTKAARFLDFILAWASPSLAQASLLLISPSFFFRTISNDRDDDKFADCAISAQADHIITNDKHFRPLIDSGFKPQPIAPSSFIADFL